MESRTITIRIDGVLYEALKKMSEEEERSLSWLCGKAIELYLEQNGAVNVPG